MEGMTASTFAVGLPKHELRLIWSSVRGEQFICTCGWQSDVDTRMSMLLLRRPFPFTQAVWIGVGAGKAHAQHLLKVQAAEEDAPHRSTCPGCGHLECDAVGENGRTNELERRSEAYEIMLAALEDIASHTEPKVRKSTPLWVQVMGDKARGAIAAAEKGTSADAPPLPPTMRPPMLIALEEIRDILVSGTHKDSGFSPEADALNDIGRAYGIAESAIADARKGASKDASTTR